MYIYLHKAKSLEILEANLTRYPYNTAAYKKNWFYKLTSLEDADGADGAMECSLGSDGGTT